VLKEQAYTNMSDQLLGLRRDDEWGRDAKVPILRVLQQFMLPMLDLRDIQICPRSSCMLLLHSNIFLLNMNIFLILIRVSHFQSSKALDNELLIDERGFGLVCSHYD
jgi:hypothetical protein